MIARSDEEREDEDVVDRWKTIMSECSDFISAKAREFDVPHDIIGKACMATANELSGLCDLFDLMTGEDDE
jgi:hypothetical protein